MTESLSPELTLPFHASESGKPITGVKDFEGHLNPRQHGRRPSAGIFITRRAIACGDHKIMHLVPFSFLGFPIGRGFRTALVVFSTWHLVRKSNEVNPPNGLIEYAL